MSKTYRSWDPDQAYLLPPSPSDWLPEDDLVYFVLDTVGTLDISAITAKYEREERCAYRISRTPFLKTTYRNFSQKSQKLNVQNRPPKSAPISSQFPTYEIRNPQYE